MLTTLRSSCSFRVRGPVAQEQDTSTTRSVTVICNGPQKCNGHCRCLQIAFRYNVYISASRIAIKFLLACAYDGVWYHLRRGYFMSTNAPFQHSRHSALQTRRHGVVGLQQGPPELAWAARSEYILQERRGSTHKQPQRQPWTCPHSWDQHVALDPKPRNERSNL
jgi:hypothetical protein